MADFSDTKLLWFLKSNRSKIYRQIVQDTEDGVSGLAPKKDVEATARELAELIQATGESSAESAGELVHDMSINKLSTTDLDPTLAPQFGLTWDVDERKYIDAYGTYYETILAKIQADAESISEAYYLQESTVLQANIDDLNYAIQETNRLLNGEIRRGFIDFNGTRYFGIVIASRNVFSQSNTSWTPDGETESYYAIDTGECFGLYTATGWQFWVGNQKLGWFDTSDGQLHVTSINIESDLQMHDWLFHVYGNRFGIKYVGA